MEPNGLHSTPDALQIRHRTHGRREKLVVGTICCLACAVVLRLCQLQGFQQREFSDRVLKQKSVRVILPARAGEILDREGRVLATSVRCGSLFVNPKVLVAHPHSIDQIADVLNQDPENLRQRIEDRRELQFLWLKRRATEKEESGIRNLRLPPNSWGIREEYLRRYPREETAAHVIGMRDIDGKGQGGVEESLDRYLHGVDGAKVMLRDAPGRVVEILNDESTFPLPGENVVLTIDAVFQAFVERTLEDLSRQWKPLSCCAVVTKPQTGEILAMASRPGFNPSKPDSTDDAVWQNRPIADIYEPGSTFKPCIIAWALQKGLLQPDEKIDCENGAYRMGRRTLHDHHPYGELSVVEILAKSSNIGMAKIGERLGNEGIHQGITAFGFGRPTGILLPGELSGVVHPLESWTNYSTGSIPMGQEIATTPLQIITAYGAIANGGRLIAPRLVKSIGGRALSPMVAQIIRPEISRWIVQDALTQVVESGTGKNAKLDGYRVFGKTGTAQKLDPKTGGYSHNKLVTSFICGAPAENPQILVIVSVDEPASEGQHYGGTVAAPPATIILERALRLLSIEPTRTAGIESSRTD